MKARAREFLLAGLILSAIGMQAEASKDENAPPPCMQCGVVEAMIPVGPNAVEMVVRMDDRGLKRRVMVDSNTTLDVGDRVSMLGGSPRRLTERTGQGG